MEVLLQHASPPALWGETSKTLQGYTRDPHNPTEEVTSLPCSRHVEGKGKRPASPCGGAEDWPTRTPKFCSCGTSCYFIRKPTKQHLWAVSKTAQITDLKKINSIQIICWDPTMWQRHLPKAPRGLQSWKSHSILRSAIREYAAL